ncbi:MULTISPECIES: lasso peptide biosynthesis PqqD family chaperone [Priestia]|uniref:lasso peptide biosynthesis PqqD family chaperone n=1 Tax=Priestia TaxID=2800373 RepID=UPI00064F7C82|nr:MULTISPECIES: lasso peptide biosynthesis PqqD family chaperone [Priestia]AWD67027.1 lasso peptide biosynthesis PqqD family chaperone [Priestia megaterium]KML27260.1 metallophosphoesterase [Priestia aryabhattai]KMN98841.1 metallophosphoesterase [Priestia aryabhattai]QDZ80701.1 lasso peptide biosynthesis PqqD family chaperone [Priestia megaterium]
MIKNQDISMNQLVSQETGHIVSDMDGEKVMLSISNGKYYNLGEIGGEIWEKIKEPISVSELISTLVTQYNVEQSDCEEQVIAFLSGLIKEGLIQVAENNRS